MEQIPRSLYIDTNVFISNGLCFEGSFAALKNVSIKIPLCLLVPEIMERELLRHYQKRAREVAGETIKGHERMKSRESNYSSKLTLAKFPSQNDLETEHLEKMEYQWSDFQNHFSIKKLPIVGDLEEVVNWYFKIQPPFSKDKKKEFPDAFVISALDAHYEKYHVNIAVISGDQDFEKACVSRRYLQYFKNLDKYMDGLQSEQLRQQKLSSQLELPKGKRAPTDIDLTQPIATGVVGDLQKLRDSLDHGSQVTSIEVSRVMKLLKPKGTNYNFFFQHADATVWLQPLSEQGYFDNPPNAKETTEGYIDAPWWPPLDYLIRIFDTAPAEVLDILSKLPDTDNFRVLEGILQIVLKADSSDAVSRFSRFITSYIENCRWGEELIIDLLKKPFVLDSQLSKVTPALLLKIVEFRRDPHEQEKQRRRKENPEAWDTLEPTPRFDEWNYQQILEQGVLPLAEREPYQVAHILIDAVDSMILLGMHRHDFDKGTVEDGSEIWCQWLDKPDSDYQDIKGFLVQALTYACEQAYLSVPESIDALDMALRNHRWKVFRRLRQHLYASCPNEQTLPWIREQILDHEDYSRWHHYEFQLMIRKASEHFGPRLLTQEEQKTIFDIILSGPSKMDFRESRGEQYSEAAFQQRQRYFHRKQLRPFATLLSGEVRNYFDRLEGEAQDDAITDDDYFLYSIGPVGVVKNQSPKSTEELQLLTDEELICYLNEWDQEHRDEDDRLIDINIGALAGVFQSLFKEQIVQDGERLAFWMTNRDRIARPIYVTAMVKAMLELVKEKDFDSLDQWIGYCTWVLSHPDPTREEGCPAPSDESRDYPDWSRSRRAVVEFIGACVSKDHEVPIVAREGLAKLLQQVCNQFDWRLDDDHPVLLNQDDPYTEAINNTRSRALHSLVKFGFWVRRRLLEDSLPEVRDILANRITDEAEIPLTRPEYALLGASFGDLCNLIPDWAIKHRESLFPRENKAIWEDVFDNYLRFNQPTMPLFEILQGEFEFAIDNLETLPEKKDTGEKLVDRLGQHLFTYYLWSAYPLVGEESLLERFYAKTNDDRKRWAQLFDYVGRSLSYSDKNLDTALINRIIAFFDRRFEVAEPIELRNFTFWLKAECLEPGWRLQSYSKILDLGLGKIGRVSSQVRALAGFLPDHLALVVECFAKITDFMDQETHIHIPVDEAKTILMAGLHVEDTEIRGKAEHAQENLLRSGRFGFLDFDQ